MTSSLDPNTEAGRVAEDPNGGSEALLRRRPKRLLGIVIIGLLAVLGLNVAGLLRYPGGPLREPSDDGALWLDLRPANQGYSSVGNDPTDWAVTGAPLYFGTVTLVDSWPVDATVEAVRPLELTPGLTIDRAVLGIVPAGSTSIGWGNKQLFEHATDDETYGGALRDLPVVVRSNTSADRGSTLILVVSAATPGRYGFRGVEIDYRIGPFRFRATQYLALDSCIGPFAPGQSCSVDE
jgi:hypothetical protein